MVHGARTACWLLATLLLSVGLIADVRADYAISVKGSSVSVVIATVFEQNLTITPTPAYNLTLSGSNSSSAEALFSSALSSNVPNARVTGFMLVSSSSGNVTRTTIKFDVEGASTITPNSVETNLAWKSFKIPEDILAGGVSLNIVGRYLADSPVLNQISSTVIQWTYFVDGKPIRYTQSTDAAAAFQILDFSKLTSPVDSWHRDRDAQAGREIFSNVESHNVTARQSVNEGGSVARTLFFAGFSNNIRIELSGVPNVIGDKVVVQSGNSLPTVMLSIAILFPVIWIGVFLVERRLSRSASFARKKARQSPRK